MVPNLAMPARRKQCSPGLTGNRNGKDPMQQHRFHPLMKMLRTVVPLGAAVLLAGCGGPAGFGTGKQTTIEPLTQNAEVVQHIYALVTWIDIAIFIVVAGLLAFAVIRYRARPGQENELPKQVHGNVLM